ncbi:purine-binding chemotaxis protein CheW [Thermodesulfovibrio aggregans]|uniref:Purine-binding chemotaxis protein CheW n=1 Tax=Thermodesulfovibrio aggregans TaxID=86166 RepID=A0A0U9HSI1_9BACT|nr:chemotaxis protein CheW [Thermodesulfovibrio aggregans]GAQ95796.1 purine-binding chemotaxis protein CheW [Thermodesulfovibrio aggregans]
METALIAKEGKISEKMRVLQLVTFTLGEEEYAVDILKVQEINRMKEITKVPNAPYYVEGVINLRGKVIPVVSLRKFFGLPEEEDRTKQKIMIMDIQGTTIGLIVDTVSEVLRISSDIVEPPPSMTYSVNSEFIWGIAKLEDRLIILLDMDRLISKEESQSMLGITEKAAIEE